jgi:hypothetical protein
MDSPAFFQVDLQGFIFVQQTYSILTPEDAEVSLQQNYSKQECCGAKATLKCNSCHPS